MLEVIYVWFMEILDLQYVVMTVCRMNIQIQSTPMKQTVVGKR